MAKNKISDLNDHLFCQLERLNDDELMKKEGKNEIEKAKAMAGIAKQIVESAKVVVVAAKVAKDLSLNDESNIKRILS